MRLMPLAPTVAAVLVSVAPAVAQPQPPAPAITGRAQPPAAPAPPRPRGVQVMTLDSPAWPDGGAIPLKHSQAGRDVSPALSWSGAPDGVVSHVLLVRDLDAVAPATGEDTLHWLVWNIPGSATSLPEAVPQGNPPPPPPRFGGGTSQVPTDGPRQMSATGPNYRGPAAPASGPPHHYVFELFALDTWVDVPAVGQPPAATRAAVVSAISGHLLGKAVRVGHFRRPPP